jgi:hypothetical protein
MRAMTRPCHAKRRISPGSKPGLIEGQDRFVFGALQNCNRSIGGQQAFNALRPRTLSGFRRLSSPSMGIQAAITPAKTRVINSIGVAPKIQSTEEHPKRQVVPILGGH